MPPNEPTAETEQPSYLDTPLADAELDQCHVQAQGGSSTGGFVWGELAERMIREIRAYRALARTPEYSQADFGPHSIGSGGPKVNSAEYLPKLNPALSGMIREYMDRRLAELGISPDD